MKVLIVFTTPNTNGSVESYNDTWDCIDEINGHREKDIDDGDKIYVFDGIDFRKPNNGWDYDALYSKINGIKQYHANAFFIVLFHAGETGLRKLKQKCNYSDTIFKRYSTADDIWTYISKFCNDQQNKSIKDKFLDLWAHLKTEDDLTQIHSLRYEILSPLVALDLITQAKKEGKSIDNETTKAVNDAATEIKTKKQIEAFCKILACGDLEEKIESLIPQEINGSLTIDHAALVDVAEQLENKIAKLELTG